MLERESYARTKREWNLKQTCKERVRENELYALNKSSIDIGIIIVT